MKLTLLVPFAAAVAAFTPLSSIDLDASTLTTQYIVELSSSSTLVDLVGEKRTTSPHEQLYDSLRRRNIQFESGEEWSSAIFVGVVITTLSDSANLAALYKTDGVVDVRPVCLFAAPEPVKQHILSGIHDPELPADTQSSHVMTGVDKMHAQAIYGQGIKIGIIDSGVDYAHPSLGGCFGTNCLITGGFDFVGDAYTGRNTPVPDNDPQDCSGHGTHVTGIIAVQPNNPFNITGVAYKSSIRMYRVFGCTGVVADPVLISALLKAYDDGNDVINMSLGGADGWSESVTGVVASRIAKKGRVVIAAVGNNGLMGAWDTQGPGSGKDVIAVGSTDNIALPALNATLDNGHDPIPYLASQPLPILNARKIYATSASVTTANDACLPLPSSTPNLANFLVLIRRGGCPLATKIQNALAFGANGVLIYNNGPSFTPINVSPYTAFTGFIRAEDGAYLLSLFTSNSNAQISFPQSGASFQLPDQLGGLTSTFSQCGPTYDLLMKPSVMAPGGNIISTMPVQLGSFAILSGTSMAAPHAAGSAALLLQSLGKNCASGMRTLLTTTAQPLPVGHTSENLQTVAQQGSGQLNVWDAANMKTLVSPGEMLLNDTQYFRDDQVITIENTSKSSVTYTLSHTPANTVLSIGSALGLANTAPLPTTSSTASVNFRTTTITIKPRKTGQVKVTFKAPSGLDPTTYPIYSGFIIVTGSNGEVLSIPYQGVASKMKDMKIIDNSNTMFGVNLPVILDKNMVPHTEDKNWTFTGTDFPFLLFRLAAGTRSLVIDLVDKDTNVPNSVHTKRGLLDWLYRNWFGSKWGKKNTFAQIPVIGTLNTTPYAHRHEATGGADVAYSIMAFTGAFLNGTAVPNGQYRMLIRALKITGDPKDESDYEAFLTPILGVTR